MKSRIMKRGESSGRSDDNEETVANRIQTFHANNQPVIDYYNKRRKLCLVLICCALSLYGLWDGMRATGAGHRGRRV